MEYWITLVAPVTYLELLLYRLCAGSTDFSVIRALLKEYCHVTHLLSDQAHGATGTALFLYILLTLLLEFLHKGGFTGDITCPSTFSHCFASSTQMKLEGKIRRLLGDEFQEKVSLVTMPSISLLTAPLTSISFFAIFILNSFVLCL